mgnify:FL=1
MIRRFFEANQDSGGDAERGRNPMTTAVVVLALLIAVGFNLALLFPEVTGGVVAINDMVMHLLLTDMAVDAIKNGRDFTDPWQGTMNMGFPFFHYYQHLPHITVALFHVVTFGVSPTADLIRWTTYLLISLFPLSGFWSLRRLGFDRLTAAMAGLVASLFATDRLFGFGFTSYTFLGFGLYSQLWAMVLILPAIALGYGVLREGQGYFWATLLLAATLMSHLMFGYIAFITLAVLTLVQLARISEPKEVLPILRQQWKRLLVLILLVGVVTSYFLIPFVMDLSYVNNSALFLTKFRDSFGHSVVLRSLFEGDLFDFRRFPSLTILVLAGLGVCLVRWREERYLVPVAVFLAWLLLYFGRATWGSLIEILPFSGDLPMHRFIAGIHLGGVLLAAVALAAPWHWAVSRKKTWYVAAVFALTVLLLAPVYIERRSFVSENNFVIEETQEKLAAEGAELSALVARLDQLPPGRVYAGPAGGPQERWGLDYRVGFSVVFSILYAEGMDMMGAIYHQYSLPSDVLRSFNETKPEQYNLYNIRYVVAPEEQELPGFVRPLEQFGRHYLYEVETTGYFDLVDSTLAFDGGRTDFNAAATAWIASDFPAAKRHPIVSLDGEFDLVMPLPLSESAIAFSDVEVSDGEFRGTVVSEDVGRDFYAAEVEVGRESMLLLKATYHPNWRATVDGMEADTVMLMPGFLGIWLAPGKHQVRVEYDSGNLRLALLALGLLTLLLIPAVEKRAKFVSSWIPEGLLARVSSSLKLPKRPESRQARRRRRRR